MQRISVKRKNRYSRILEAIFRSKIKRGGKEIVFERIDIERFARQLRIRLPKNLGDLIYSFRYRTPLPKSIQKRAEKGKTWVIRPAGRARYTFVQAPDKPIAPNKNLAETKVPDCTPGIVAKYAFKDEQALLAKVRYNRLVDIFTGVTCYSLQNHLRTTVRGIGQVETDELYVGVDKRGVHFVFPIQAKGGKDKLSIIQVEQDMAVCAEKFPQLVCRPVAAQFLQDDAVAMFEFEQGQDGLGIAAEKHYKLVPPEEVTQKDLENYRARLAD